MIFYPIVSVVPAYVTALTYQDVALCYHAHAKPYARIQINEPLVSPRCMSSVRRLARCALRLPL